MAGRRPASAAEAQVCAHSMAVCQGGVPQGVDLDGPQRLCLYLPRHPGACLLQQCTAGAAAAPASALVHRLAQIRCCLRQALVRLLMEAGQSMAATCQGCKVPSEAAAPPAAPPRTAAAHPPCVRHTVASQLPLTRCKHQQTTDICRRSCTGQQCTTPLPTARAGRRWP